MDNYEINILRRSGNWKKVKPDDLVIDNNNSYTKEKNEFEKYPNNDFFSYISKVNSIIEKLENLESEKNKLRTELKLYEDQFLNIKKITEKKIEEISLEKEMIDKTIKVIKNLKNF